MADGVSGFYPVDQDRDGVFEIQAYQKNSGLYHADIFKQLLLPITIGIRNLNIIFFIVQYDAK